MADKLIPTPSQTVGPFFHLGMVRAEWGDLTADRPAGEQIAIEGRVIDVSGFNHIIVARRGVAGLDSPVYLSQVADVVAYLLSEHGHRLTGHVLRVGGNPLIATDQGQS